MYLSGLYLLIFDKLLIESGFFHWIILLVYLIVMAALVVIRRVSKNGIFTALTGVFAILMFLAQMADAALNLPVSGFSGNNGFSYLFGFGTTPLSSFGTSLGFTVFLAFNLVLGAICIYAYRSKKSA